MKKFLIVSSIILLFISGAFDIYGGGENITVTQDSVLHGTFGSVTITSSGTVDDYLEVNATDARMRSLKVEGSYVKVFGGDDSFKSQIKRDKIKKKYCKLNSIDLLVIPYWKIQGVEKIIIKRIIQKGGQIGIY